MPGPQIRVIDGGAGLDETIAIVNSLAEGGVEVTDVTTAKEAKDVTKVYYRGDSQATADKVAAMIRGGVPVEKLEKDGWVDVMVFIGK